ncbi:hypothetical protein [Streptomyces sp. Da 82-17]|uniref:hypothetical protein n=1 Tax=Streptomyces sp. Da 82-17 TaxID=3377116 RepID=UPI0038D4BC5F
MATTPLVIGAGGEPEQILIDDGIFGCIKDVTDVWTGTWRPARPVQGAAVGAAGRPAGGHPVARPPAGAAAGRSLRRQAWPVASSVSRSTSREPARAACPFGAGGCPLAPPARPRPELPSAVVGWDG